MRRAACSTESPSIMRLHVPLLRTLCVALALAVVGAPAADAKPKSPTKKAAPVKAAEPEREESSSSSSVSASDSSSSSSSDDEAPSGSGRRSGGDSALYAEVKEAYEQGVRLEKTAQNMMFAGGAFNKDALLAANKAIEAFDAAVVKAGRSKDRDVVDLRELSKLSAGWVQYAQGGYLYEKKKHPADRPVFAKAAETFLRVERFGRHWPNALFGAAYASFRSGEFGKALGFLQTLRAGFADAPLLPEADLLRAYIYYQVCLYAEANSAMDDLRDGYKEIREALDKLTKGSHGDSFYSSVLTKDRVEGISVPLRLQLGVRAALWRPGSRGEPTGAEVHKALEWLREDLEKFDLQAAKLRSEVGQLEMQTKGSGFNLEDHLRTQSLGRPRLARRRMERWSFNGEYWPDELGRYQYVIKNGCPPEGGSESEEE